MPAGSSQEPDPPSEGPQSISIQKHDIIVALIGVVGGALLSIVLPELSDRPRERSLWLFGGAVFMVMGVSLLTLSFVRTFMNVSRNDQKYLLQLSRTIESAVVHQAQLVPRNAIYAEMAECIRKAHFQVEVITWFAYDWDHSSRNWMPAEDDPPGRDDFYEAIDACIRANDVEYVRVWMVPKERVAEAEAVISRDGRHKQEIDAIREVAESHPESARFVIAEQVTTASYILIDRKALFINIDFFDSERGKWLSPFMLFVKDARGEAFASLRSVIVRLTARSSGLSPATAPAEGDHQE